MSFRSLRSIASAPRALISNHVLLLRAANHCSRPLRASAHSASQLKRDLGRCLNPSTVSDGEQARASPTACSYQDSPYFGLGRACAFERESGLIPCDSCCNVTLTPEIQCWTSVQVTWNGSRRHSAAEIGRGPGTSRECAIFLSSDKLIDDADTTCLQKKRFYQHHSPAAPPSSSWPFN